MSFNVTTTCGNKFGASIRRRGPGATISVLQHRGAGCPFRCFNTARAPTFVLQHGGAGRLFLPFNSEARGAYFCASTQGLILCFHTEARCAYFCASTRRRGAATIVLQSGAPASSLWHHYCASTRSRAALCFNMVRWIPGLDDDAPAWSCHV